MKAKITKQLLSEVPPKDSRYEICDTDLTGFRVRISPSGELRYTYRYHNREGRQRVYTLGGAELTPTQARLLAQQKAAEVTFGVDIQAVKQAERGAFVRQRDRTLLAYVETQWYPWAAATQKSAAETYRVIQKDFAFLHQVPLDQISKDQVKQWMASQTLKPSTVNRRVNALKGVLSHAVEAEVIPVSPLRGLKGLNIDRHNPPTYFTNAEEKRLRQALVDRERHHQARRDSGNAWRLERGYPLRPVHESPFSDHLMPLVLLDLNTGLRLGELFALEWKDINFTHRQLTVRGANAKNGQSRHIPLNTEAYEVLRDWRQTKEPDSDLVFPSPTTGEKMTNIRTAWRALAKSAGLEGRRFHDLRHTFASNLIMKGVDLNTVRELLGHKSLDTTLIYAHLAPEHKVQAVARLADRTDAPNVVPLQQHRR